MTAGEDDDDDETKKRQQQLAMAKMTTTRRRRRRRQRRRCDVDDNNNDCGGRAVVTKLATSDGGGNNSNSSRSSHYLDWRFEAFLLFVSTCGIFQAAPLYGFNVFVLPLLEEFSSSPQENGVDAGTTTTTTTAAALTMSDGNPVYASGMAIFFCTVANFFVAPRMGAMGYGTTLLVGLVVAAVGLVLTFVSVRYRVLWLFYVGYGVVFGVGTGWINIPLLTNMLLWFRTRRGRPGLGSGLFGFAAGIWAAAFSYFGVALQNAVGISYSFLVLALLLLGLGLWVTCFLYPPDAILTVPAAAADDDYDGDRDESEVVMTASTTAKGRDSTKQEKETKKANDGPPNARPDNALSGRDLVRTRQFWLIMALYFFALFPGFGVKLAISPLMKGVFDASESTQSAVSSMFLASYAVGRLAFGPLVDRYSAKGLLLGCFAVQVAVCVALGAIIWYAAEGRTGIWSFAAVNVVLGLVLAAAKAIYSVFVLTIFGAPSVGAAMGRLFVGLGASAFAGPVAMWSVLVSASESLNGDTGDSVRFTHSVSLFFWISAAGTVASIAILMAVKPYEFDDAPGSPGPAAAAAAKDVESHPGSAPEEGRALETAAVPRRVTQEAKDCTLGGDMR